MYLNVEKGNTNIDNQLGNTYMISNITNTLPALLKHMQNNEQMKNPEFNLIDSINFYKSILPKKKEMDFLKHLHLDCIFKVKDEYNDIVSNFNLSVDSLEFLKDFYYEAKNSFTCCIPTSSKDSSTR